MTQLKISIFFILSDVAVPCFIPGYCAHCLKPGALSVIANKDRKIVITLQDIFMLYNLC